MLNHDMKLKLKHTVTLISSWKYTTNLLYLLTVLITASPAWGQTPRVSNTRDDRDTISTNQQTLGVPELVRTRCSTDKRNVYTEWTGSIYAYVPQEEQQKLFNIIGMNVARCLKNQQQSFLYPKRELTHLVSAYTLVSFFTDSSTFKTSS